MTLEEAYKIRDQLVSLHQDRRSGGWMAFMEAIPDLVPDILVNGRPSKHSINHCVIGMLGYNSWQEFISSSLEDGGLAWNVSGWRAWRRAWLIVKQYPWIREAALSSSQVNLLRVRARRRGVPLPSSLTEYEKLKNAPQPERLGKKKPRKKSGKKKAGKKSTEIAI